MSQQTLFSTSINILDYLSDSPQPVSGVAKLAGLSIRETTTILTLAALNGTAVEVYSGAYKLAETAVTPEEPTE
jgi:hypothetical protein